MLVATSLTEVPNTSSFLPHIPTHTVKNKRINWKQLINSMELCTVAHADQSNPHSINFNTIASMPRSTKICSSDPFSNILLFDPTPISAADNWNYCDTKSSGCEINIVSILQIEPVKSKQSFYTDCKCQRPHPRIINRSNNHATSSQPLLLHPKLSDSQTLQHLMKYFRSRVFPCPLFRRNNAIGTLSWNLRYYTFE